MTTRRDFIDRLALGGLSLTALSAIPASLGALPVGAPASVQGGWDTSWSGKLTGRVKAVFDVPEVESGFGVWRASIWAMQYEAVLGIPARETSTALVLRHNAIILAMQQAFWDRYGIGKAHAVTHPLTGASVDRNPALLDATDGIDEPYANFALVPFQARGGIVLACDLALQDLVALIERTDKVSNAEATRMARGWLVPGVILQPSGVFSVLRAQEVGALYIRAS